MGNCSGAAKETNAVYSTQVVLNIKPNIFQQAGYRNTLLKVTLSTPSKQFTDLCEIKNFRLKISACVLPGQDPRGEVEKICQDNVFIRQKPEFFLATLFDGHGSNGHKVAEFSENFMEDFFETQDFTENTTEDFIKEMFLECDQALISNTKKISVYGSGSTAVSLIFAENGIYAGSVGDSRAILATLPADNRELPKLKKTSGFKSEFKPSRYLEPIQLTIDQKPNLETELKRILAHGGVVSKATNTVGEPYGPYRVFQKSKPIPGLAMSRSLGDVAAKQVGVIADPIVEFFPLVNFKDQFIVIASDGVWDTIENNDVVNFVETFRGQCSNFVIEHKDLELSQKNCTIARLLAEEARFRWLGECIEQDVMIDDISVLVIELSCKEITGRDESYEESRTSSKNLGSIMEVQNDHASLRTPSIRSTMTCFEDIDMHEN